MKKIIYLFALAMLSSGCVMRSEFIKTGEDSFKYSRKTYNGFGSSTANKCRTMSEAKQFCADKGKLIQITSNEQSRWFNYPKTDLEFLCLDANDPRLKADEVKTIQQLSQGIKNEGDDLETKLKTLNKLLSDGLITKNEFDEQKKKLLDDYANK